MKKLSTALALTFVLLHCDIALAGSALTGHVWRKASGQFKLIYIEAYLDGYTHGYLFGAGKERNLKLIDFTKHPLIHYINEIDSFYDAFPLCRGNELSDMMLGFVWVWTIPGTEYRYIGEECGAKK